MLSVDNRYVFASTRTSLGRPHTSCIAKVEDVSIDTVMDTFVSIRKAKAKKVPLPDFDKIQVETEKHIKAAVSFPSPVMSQKVSSAPVSHKRVREWKDSLDACATSGHLGFIPESLQKHYSGSKMLTWEDFVKTDAGKAVIKYDTYLEKRE